MKPYQKSEVSHETSPKKWSFTRNFTKKVKFHMKSRYAYNNKTRPNNKLQLYHQRSILAAHPPNSNNTMAYFEQEFQRSICISHFQLKHRRVGRSHYKYTPLYNMHWFRHPVLRPRILPRYIICTQCASFCLSNTSRYSTYWSRTCPHSVSFSFVFHISQGPYHVAF